MHRVSIEDKLAEAELPRYLWTPPDQRVDPPIETKQILLPVSQLSWQNAERLFLRLLARIERVHAANMFGVAGQAQDGIDIYARIHSAVSPDRSDAARPFVVLQSKRVLNLTPGEIGTAVDAFIQGDWAERSKRFYYATSHSLQPTQLDDAVRAAEQRLGERGIEFVPWGIDRLSDLLRSEPDIIDDFFGRVWVRVVCGTDVAQNLAERLTNSDVDELRAELSRLYRSVFKTQDTGVATYGFSSTDSATADFIVLDGTETQKRLDTSAFVSRTDEHGTAEAPTPASGWPARRSRQHRPSRRLRLHASVTTPTREHESMRESLDTWLTAGRLNVLVGEPGSGKSSFLRFVALDILSDDPQSSAIAREFGRSLPIWLPFAFLCSHLRDGESRSVLSAVQAWLSRQDCDALWPLVERAMSDERLLLVIDGLDEWTDPRLAEAALGQLEIFLDHRDTVVAISSTRPYALNVLALTLNWRYMQIAPLTEGQQRAIVERVLCRSDAASSATGSETASAGRQIALQVDGFLYELESLQHIADLARSPLFLVLLASVWSGEPLPTRRFDIYGRLVTLLIVHHPQMRRRSSQVAPGGLSPEASQRVWAAVAFKLRQENATGYASTSEMRKLVVDALMDDTVLYWPESRAREAADDILTTAEQHLGLMVPYGSGTIGFIHRVVYEYLAGEHLSRCPLAEQVTACRQRTSDPAWRDVILSTLSAQIRPTDAKFILDDALARGSDDLPTRLRLSELLAEAIACDVLLSPRDIATFIDQLVTEVDESPWLPHRMVLVTSLTAALASEPARELLAPRFARWMRARTAEPGPALLALAHQTEISDEVAWSHMVWGLRHTEEVVQLSAADAIAHRFGADRPRLDMLVELARSTASSEIAAAVVLAAAKGWPQEVETSNLITWARAQQSLPLRVAGILGGRESSLVPDAFQLTDPEKRWITALFRHERLGGPWERLAYPLVPLAVGEDPSIADECLETLTRNETNSWDRQVAWVLAREVFGDDPRFRDWVVSELKTDHPLVMYPVSQLPEHWGQNGAFRQAVVDYITRQASQTIHEREIYELSALVPCPEIRDALLGCLDTWHPSWIVRALLRDYPDDPKVGAALVERFSLQPAQAVKYSFVAMEYLGLTEGFAFLRDMLAHEGDQRREAAMALSIAWVDCRAIVEANPGSIAYQPERVPEAEAILSSYDGDALALMCLDATLGGHELLWSDYILRAWPNNSAVVERAKALLDQPNARTAAVIAAYGGLSDFESRALTESALSQLEYLEPALRETIATELGAHNHDPRLVVGLLLDQWVLDYDRAVSRTSAVTLAHSLKRAAALRDASVLTPDIQSAIETFNAQVETEMTALGTALEERRQVGWIAMLITQNYDLLLRTHERRRPAEPARVPLHDLFGETDLMLTGLVAQSWEELERRCPGSLFDRFGSFFGGESDGATRERAVWAHLATVAQSYPAVADRLRSKIATDEELRADPQVIRWMASQEPSVDSLRALLRTLGRDARSYRAPEIDLIDSLDWRLSPQEIREHVLGAATSTWKCADGSDITASPIELNTRWRLHGDHLVLFAQLYPHDPLTQARYEDLRRDLTQYPRSNAWTWPEVIALAVNAAQAKDLPAVLLRIYGALVAGDAYQFQLMFLRAVSRRLRGDQDALAAIIVNAQYGAEITPPADDFLAGYERWVRYEADDLAYWRIFFFAKLLDGCRLLGESSRDAFKEALALPVPLLVVHDPVGFQERLLNVAWLDLLVQYESSELQM